MRNPFLSAKWHQFWGRDAKGRFRTISTWIKGEHPPYLSLTLTGPCPIKCNCCPWELYKKAGERLPNRSMPLETFKRIVENVPSRINLEFSGFTEPATNPEMPDMVLYAKAKGHAVQVFSTLIGLSDEGMAKLSTVKFEKFVVHVPDSVNMIFDTDRWIAILRRFRKHRIGGVVFGSLGPVDQKLRDELRDDHLFMTYVFNKESIKGKEGGVRNEGKLRCSFNYSGLNLDQNCVIPNGDVCICPQDFGTENIVGNLLTQTYEEIMAGEPIRDFRRRMMSEHRPVLCRNCEYAKPLHSGQRDPRNVHRWLKTAP